MDTSSSDRHADASRSAPSRRGFLHQTAGIAAAITTMTPSVQAADQPTSSSSLLPTIQLGPHRVTRLIIGSKPIYGISHFNKHFDRHLTTWHTPERVMELLKRCEECGLNTFQSSYSERARSDLERYRSSGGTMNWLCLGKVDWLEHPELIDDAAKHKPIGISPHGHLNEDLHHQKKYNVLTDLLKRIRDQGVLVGLSAHDPTLIELAEEKGLDVDYYMTALYFLSRTKEEQRAILGNDLPLGVGSGVPPRCGAASRRRLPTSSRKMRRLWECTSSSGTKLLKMPPSSGRSGRGDEQCILTVGLDRSHQVPGVRP